MTWASKENQLCLNKDRGGDEYQNLENLLQLCVEGRIDQQQPCVNSHHQLASPFMNTKQRCHPGSRFMVRLCFFASSYIIQSFTNKLVHTNRGYMNTNSNILCSWKELPIFWERKEFLGKFCHILTVFKKFRVCFSTSFFTCSRLMLNFFLRYPW